MLLPLIGGGIGYLFKRFLDKKKEVFNENAKERRVKCLIGNFCIFTKTG